MSVSWENCKQGNLFVRMVSKAYQPIFDRVTMMEQNTNYQNKSIIMFGSAISIQSNVIQSLNSALCQEVLGLLKSSPYSFQNCK